MRIFLLLYVIAAGALTTVESGANAKLTDTLGGPWWAALLFSIITVILLIGIVLVAAGPFPAGRLGSVPWWAWTGGVISTCYIISMMVAPGVLGAGVFTGLTVTASLVASVVLDHYGLVGFPVHPASLGRLIGTALMIGGIALVAVF